MNEHAPPPYKMREDLGSGVAITAYGDDAPQVVAEIDPYKKEPLRISMANAAFIVRACNSHNALMEACQAALDLYSDQYPQRVSDWDDDHDDMGNGKVKPMLRAALAAAKEPS